MQLRQHRAQLQFFVAGGQFLPAFGRAVAVGLAGRLVPGHGPCNAAVLAQGYGAGLRTHPQGVKVVVQGVYIPAALIVPAAGFVHKAGVVQRTDCLHCPGGIVLSPALIEGHPAAHAGVAAQRLHRICQLPAVFFPAAFAAPAQ